MRRDKTRGGTTIRRDDERAARREATHTTTSRRDERMSGPRTERTRRGNVTQAGRGLDLEASQILYTTPATMRSASYSSVFRVQTESVGEVAAMVIAHIEQKPE